ncbi:MAG: hypothetical protein EP329_02805 [Deltaproteobacteria bacterium]|nr:MAG: hypothetical protein EP329_02805 [Deltaproteobacteria bacterium]
MSTTGARPSPPPLRPRPGALAALTLALALCAPSAGAAPLPAEGQPITTSSYALDLFRGPLLTGTRATGLAGAVVALADETGDAAMNPAAPALRAPWSVRPFDWDLGLSASFASAFADVDFDNDGEIGFVARDFVFVDLGLRLQMGRWGLALVYDLQSYALEADAASATSGLELNAILHRAHLVLSRTFFDGQLIVGGGFRLAALAIETPVEDERARELFSTAGLAPELGLLWAPRALPLRLGLAVRAGVTSAGTPESEIDPDANGDLVIDGIILPHRVALPWEVEVGASVQLGPRLLNPRWVGPKLAPLLPRQKVLLTAALLVSGAVDDAVGTEAFQRQQVQRSGESVSLTPRLGVEVEPISATLQLRAGSYLEPSRFRRGEARLHGTGGFDLKLLCWSVWGLFADDTCWRLSGAIDGARDYLNWSVSLGAWH